MPRNYSTSGGARAIVSRFAFVKQRRETSVLFPQHLHKVEWEGKMMVRRRWQQAFGLLLACFALSVTRTGWAEWVVTGYTSGGNEITITGSNNQPWHKSYAGTPPNEYGGEGKSGNSSPRNNLLGPGDVSCTGEIKATITWNGTEPRPKSVIVKETIKSSWGGASGSCSDGLGGTEVPASGGYGGSCETVKYSVETNPGATFTRTESPTATASGSVPGGVVYSSASVKYKVEVIPVELTFSGQTDISGAKHYLVGQGMGVTLGAGGFTQSGHTWTVTGGEPFKEWVRTDTSSTGANENFAKNEATLKCYFRKADPVTVTCAATVATPSGTLAVTAEGKVTVDAPTSTFNAVIGTTREGNPNINGGLPIIGLYATVPQPLTTNGIVWTAKVSLPDDYQSAGTFYFMNIASKPARSQTDNSGVVHPANINDIRCLDVREIFKTRQFTTGPDFTDPPVEDTPSKGTSYDYPQVNISQDEFETYLMFIPPGGDAVAVPLKRIKWWWKGQIKFLAGEIPDYELKYADQKLYDAVEWRVHPTWDNNTSHINYP